MSTKPEEAEPKAEAPVEAQPAAEAPTEAQVEKPSGGKKRGVRIHVKNLSESADGELLKTLFAPFGEVMEADVKKDDSGKCKGFGFVILPTEDEATKAIAEMNGKTVEEKELVAFLWQKKDKEGKGTGDEKGKGKGKGKGKKGDDKGKGKGKKGKGPPGSMDYYNAMNPYMYGMPPYGYGMYMPPYMYGMPPYGYPMPPMFDPAAMAAAAAAPMQLAEAESSGTGTKAQGAGKGKTKGKKKESAVSQDAPPPNKEFSGSLKSKSEKNGYGFITCAEAKELYDRDVWVDHNALPAGVKEGDKLKFNITLGSKGHPQAGNVKLA